jgi:hypothetical protein
MNASCAHCVVWQLTEVAALPWYGCLQPQVGAQKAGTHTPILHSDSHHSSNSNTAHPDCLPSPPSILPLQVLCTRPPLMLTPWWWVCCPAPMPTLTTSLTSRSTSSTAAPTKCTTTATGALMLPLCAGLCRASMQGQPCGPKHQPLLASSRACSYNHSGHPPLVGTPQVQVECALTLQRAVLCCVLLRQAGCAPERPPAHLDPHRRRRGRQPPLQRSRPHLCHRRSELHRGHACDPHGGRALTGWLRVCSNHRVN